MAAGPSRILRVEVGGRTFLLVTCYTANTIAVIDPELGLVSTVAGLAGPFEMAFDATAERLVVVNYANSTLGVVDLGPLARGERPALLATLGRIDAPSPF